MSWFNYDKTECRNCTEPRMEFILERDRGEYIMWCRACGTLLKANKHDPISCTDYKVPRLNILNDYK